MINLFLSYRTVPGIKEILCFVILVVALPGAVYGETFRIPSQSMDSALKIYSKQARRHLFYVPKVTKGKHSGAVIGEYSVDDALIKLLEGSGLTFTKNARGGISIVVEKKTSLPRSAGDEIDEVIVTAQKRFQDVQKVGIAVDVFSEKEIKRHVLEDTSGIGMYSMNVSTANVSGTTQPSIFIRGVGLNDTRINNTPPTGLYVDEILMSSSALMGLQIFDMERVELLKGPQGTLYGRNTIAGTLSFFTKKPTSTFEGNISVGLGNYNQKKIEGVLSGPITDNLQVRLSILDKSRNGHQKNTFLDEYHGGIDVTSSRFKVSWQPTSDSNITANIFSTTNNSQGYNVDAIPTGDPSVIQGDGPSSRADFDAIGDEKRILDPDIVTCFAARSGNQGLARLACTDYLGYADTDGDPNRGQWNVRPTIDNETYGISTIAEWDIGSVRVSSITGYVSLSRDRHEDRDGSPQRLLDSVYINELKQLSQEFRFSSDESGDLSWIIGVFLFGDKYNTKEEFDFTDNMGPSADSPSLFIPITEYIQKTSSLAAFSHLGYQINEPWRAVLGLRYTWEKKEFEGGSLVLLEPGSAFDGLAASRGLSTESDQNGVLPLFGAGGCIYDGTQRCEDSFKVSDLSGKVALEYTGFDSLFLYGSLSKGFKSGGFNGSIGLDPGVYEPIDAETIWAYEFGLKSSYLENRLRLNTAIFHYEYEDLQFKDNVLFNESSGFGLPYTELANSGKANVFGAEVDLWWMPVHGLEFEVGASYIDFEIDSNASRLGKTQTHTPERSLKLGFRYERAITDKASIAFTIDGKWQSEVFQDAQNSSILVQDSYTLANGSIVLFPEDNRWNIMLWGKNLTDEEYSQFGFNLLGGIFSLATEIPAIGRTYGISTIYRFN